MKAVNSVSSNAEYCGCLATSHAFIGSCIKCGRLFCEKEEGVEKCFHCHSLYVPPFSKEEAQTMGLDIKTVRAYSQKDKLIIFDREHAKRTQVCFFRV